MNTRWSQVARRLLNKGAVLGTALVAGLLMSRLHAEAPLMSVPGAFSVSGGGAATYTIAVSVPPGTAGVVPGLSLEYSSDGGNGYLGLGWQLAGLASIQRCGRTVAQDGIKGSVTFTATDRFCLNGERLVAISGAYGANGTEYRTEVESFTRVVSYGTAGTGPQWFKVWTKAGEILEFGNTADSRLLRYAAATTTVRGWYVNKRSDTAGNYWTVSYQNTVAAGEIYPTQINYTGHEGTPTLAPYNSVRFEYVTRNDPAWRYQAAGELSRTTLLLSKVKTFTGSAQVNEYQLSYLPGSSVRPSRLQAVTLCAATATDCLPATTFTWPSASDSVTFTSNSTRTFSPSTSTFTGDLNGDGLPDFMTTSVEGSFGSSDTATYWMSTSPDNWQALNKSVAHQRPALSLYPNLSLSSYWLYLRPLDFNGDGYTDALADEFSTYVDIYTYQEVNYGPMRVSTSVNDKNGNLIVAKSGTGGTVTDAVPFGDLDGDGRDDLVALRPSPNSAIPYASNGDGSFSAGNPIANLYANTSIGLAGDFDGNGCMDGLLQGAVNQLMYDCEAAQGTVAISNWLASGYKLVLGDFNGDGMTDVLTVHPSSTGKLYLATGASLIDSGYTTPAAWGRYQVMVGDFNGDGRMDLALIAANSIGGNYGPTTPHQIFLSTGTGFASAASIANPTGDAIVSVDDFNGDGVADLWIYKPSAASNKNVEYVTNYQPQLISAIDNGLGAVTKISYNRLNASPSVYTKSSGAVYPERELIGPQSVVTQVQYPNGIGGTRNYQYAYSGARLHQQGRGLMGFAKVTLTDLATNIVTTTTYRQDYPFTGRIASETQTSGSVTLRSTTNTYAADTLSSGDGQRRFVKLTQSATSAKDLNGAALPSTTSTYTYDAYGNPLTLTVSGSGGDTQTTTNVYTNTVSSTSWLLGRLTSATTVHALSGQTSITRKSAFQYDATTGLMSSEQIEPGNSALALTSAYTRDGFGNITTTTISGSDIVTRSSSNTYDTQGRFVLSRTNAQGHLEKFTYSAAFGSVTQYTDPNNLISSYQYGTFGHLLKSTDPDGRYRDTTYYYCSGVVAGGTASCPANAAGEMTTTPKRAGGTVQSGPATRTYYDRLSRVVAEDIQGIGGAWIRTAYEYDARGNLRRASRPYFLSGGTAQWTTYTYDILERPTDTQYPDASHTTATYNGLTTSSTNAKSQTTTTLRNAQGQIARVTDALAGATDYSYSAAGDLLQSKDPAGNTTVYTVDVRGRVTQRKDPSLGTWTYQYNVLDQLKQQTDAKNQITTLTYDKLGRLTQRVEVGLTSTFTYDTASKGIGQLAQMDTNAGNRRSHTYDAYGRPLSTTVRLDNIDATFTSSYDADGHLYTVQYPSGFVARYEYTANQNYLQYLKDHSSGSALWTANTRNAEGQYTQATLQGGVVINRTFNAQTGRLTATTAGPAPSPSSIANLNYAYDTLGNLTSRNDATQSLTETFTYDALNRLKTAVIGSTTKQTNYNAAGNLISKTQLGSATLNTYNYPAAGAARPYAISSITGTLNGVTNPSFTYDANGNLQSGAGRSLTWTSFNMAASLSQGSTTLSYLYDAAHQRLKQTSTTGTTTTTTKYFNDPTSGVSAEQLTTAGGTWNDYLFAGGERVGMRSKTTSPAATTWQLYISDPQGSIAVILNTTASVLQRLSYDAWGRPRQANGSADPSGTLTPPMLLSTRGYTDHEHLSGISLINMNGRLYDPEVGQFLSPDPVTQSVYQVQGLNRNSYVLNNPLYYTDPSGFSWWTDVRDDWLKPALGIAVGWYVGPAIFSAVKGYAVAAFGGSAAGSFAASSLAGIASGSLVGGMNGVIFNGPRGFAQGAKSGAIGGAVSGAFAFMNPGDVLNAKWLAMNSLAGGVTSAAQGGNFGDGFKYAAVGSSLIMGATKAADYYKSRVGGPVRMGPGDTLPEAFNEQGEWGLGYYPPVDGRAPGVNFNVIGLNEHLVKNDFLRNFFRQAGPLSNTLNYVPGINAVAHLHDWWFNSNTLPFNSIVNVGSMLPAAGITYSAAAGQFLQAHSTPMASYYLSQIYEQRK
jgi:RHS repeat-associated protein